MRSIDWRLHSTKALAPTEWPTECELVLAALRRRISVRVLITGETSAVARMLARVQEHCDGPLYDCPPGTASELPAGVGTVILRNVSSLNLDEQELVTAWLTEDGRGYSLLATSVEPLFPSVTSGAFSPALFLSPESHHHRVHGVTRMPWVRYET